MSDTDGPGLARRLRESTKEIHDTSDKLVNLKLGVAMSDDKVWANGLLVFAKLPQQWHSRSTTPAISSLIAGWLLDCT